MQNSLEDVLIALRRVIRATDLHSKFLAKTTGLTTPQMLLLQILSQKGAITVGELAGGMSLSQATVTTILDRLEKRELVTRRRSTTDRRKVYVHLTETASAMLLEAPVPLQQQFAQRFGELEHWEQTQLLASLQRLASMMNASTLEASPLLHSGAVDRAETA